ncbi:unnamed protein product [Penicillium pancosmium]
MYLDKFRVIDVNEQRGKGRVQQVAGKLRIAYHESSLDQLNTSLERLKATMLLLLNVITYAGQIRSKRVPIPLQEQRDSIQSLLQGQSIYSEKPPESDAAGESERDFPPQPSQMNFNPTSTDSLPGQKGIPYHQPVRRNRPRSLGGKGMPPVNPTNETGHILFEIESSKQTLQGARHARIKNGILNIHSGEILRFQMEHGQPVHIDHSLFARKCEIERLERELAKYRGKPSVFRDKRRSRPVRKEEAWDSESSVDEEMVKERKSLRRRSEEAKERSQSAQWRLQRYEEEVKKDKRQIERVKKDPSWRYKAFDKDEEK